MYATFQEFEKDMFRRTWRDDFEAMNVEGLLDGTTVHEVLAGTAEEKQARLRRPESDDEESRD